MTDQAVVSPFESLARVIWLNSYKERIFAVMAFDYSYVYASYLDESFDYATAGLFTVGGLIGQGPSLFELDRKWQGLLEKHDLAYFKASECEWGQGHFAKFVKTPGKPTPAEKIVLEEISMEFIRLIIAEEVFGHGIVVDQKDFYQTIKDPTVKSALTESPYRLAYDLAMVQCAWMMKAVQQSLNEESLFGTRIKRPHVSFVCDEHEQHSPMANAAYRDLKKANPDAEQYMASFTSCDDKKVPVLQAADAMVYAIRRSAKVGLGIIQTNFSQEFKTLKQSHRIGLVQYVDSKNLDAIVKRKPQKSYDLSDLMERVFDSDIHYPFGQAA